MFGIVFFFFFVDTKQNCVAHSRRLVSANMVKSVNLLTVRMNCVRFNVIQNTKLNTVAHFTVLACAHTDHVVISFTIYPVKMTQTHEAVAAIQIAMKRPPFQMEMLHANSLAAKMIRLLYQIALQRMQMDLAVILHRPMLMLWQKLLDTLAPSKMNQCQLQAVNSVVAHQLWIRMPLQQSEPCIRYRWAHRWACQLAPIVLHRFAHSAQPIR